MKKYFSMANFSGSICVSIMALFLNCLIRCILFGTGTGRNSENPSGSTMLEN